MRRNKFSGLFQSNLKSRRGRAALLAAMLAATTPALASVPDITNQFTNAGSSPWTTAGNWSYGTVPTYSDLTLVQQGTATIGTGDVVQAGQISVQGTGSALSMSDGSLDSIGDILVGNGTADNVGFTFSGGILQARQLWISAGSGTTATGNITGGTVIVGRPVVNGTVNVGTATVSTEDFVVGSASPAAAGATGILNISGGHITNYGRTIIGRNAGTGTVNMSGGTWDTLVGFAWAGGNAKGTINQSGGTINAGFGTTNPRDFPNSIGSSVIGANNASASTCVYAISGSAVLNVDASLYIGGSGGNTIAQPYTSTSGFGDLIMNGGTINLGGPDNPGGANNFMGSLRVGNSTGSSAALGRVFINDSTATLNAPGGISLGSRAAGTTANGTGQMTISAGKVLTPKGSVIIGEIRVSTALNGSGALTLTGTGLLRTNSIIWLKATPTSTVSQTFTWTGGTLEINSAQDDYPMINNGGTLKPGADAVGAFTLTGAVGSYTQNATGTLALDLGGDNSYDNVNATGATIGTISVAGAVNVTTVGGYAPGYGAAFPVLSAKTTLTDTATWNFVSAPAPAGFVWDQRVISEGGNQIKVISIAPSSSTSVASGSSWTGPGASGAAFKLNGGGGDINVDANITAGYVEVSGGNLTIGGSSTLTFSAASGRAGMTAYGNNTTVNAPISFVGSGTIATPTPLTKVTLNGTVAGSSTVTKTGPGTLELRNTGSGFSGTWAISGGTLNIDSDANLGAAGASLAVTSATVTTNNAWNSSRAINLQGTGMTIAPSADSTLSGVISGTGGLTKDGSATLHLSGANIYTGATTINLGTLSTGSSNAIPALSPVVLAGANPSPTAMLKLNGNATSLASLASSGAANFTAAVDTGGADLTVGSDNTTTLFRGNIDGGGAGTFTKVGTGLFEITGVPSTDLFNPNRSINVATIDVQGGILQYDNLAPLLKLPTGNINVASGAAVSLSAVSTVVVDTLITGAGDLQFHGGSIELTGANTYTGSTELRLGAIVILDSVNGTGHFDGLGSDATPVTAKSASLSFGNANQIQFTTSGTFSKPIVVEDASILTLSPGDGVTVTYDKPVSGVGNITYGGTGINILNVKNTNTGTTYINQATGVATVKLGIDDAINSVGFVRVSDVLDLNGHNLKIASLIGAIDGKIIITPGNTLTLGLDNRDTATLDPAFPSGYSAVITGSGDLVKVGGGTQLMTLKYDAANTFTGPTHIQEGAIRWNGDSRVTNTTSSITVDAGALAVFGFTTAASLGAPVIGVPISGAGAVEKANGAGETLELTNTSNSYSGGTTIAGGVMIAGADSVLGASTGRVRFIAGPAAASLLGAGLTSSRIASLQFKNAFNTSRPMVAESTIGYLDTLANNVTASGVLSGTGGFGKIGSGTLTLTGASTYTGNTHIVDGIVSVSSLGSTGGSPANLGNPASTSQTILGANQPSTTGRLLYTGAGETSIRNFTLAGNGTIENAGSGKLTINGGVTMNPWGLTLDGAQDGEITGAMTGIAGGVVGVNVTAGGSAYTTASVVSFTGGGGSGATATQTLSGTAIGSVLVNTYGSGYTTPPAVGFTVGTGATATALISNANLTKNGAGTWKLSGVNNIPGAVTVNQGVLEMSANQTYGSLTANNAKAKVTGAGTTVVKTATVATSGTGQIDLTKNKMIVTGMSAGTTAFPYTGVTALVKAGQGTITGGQPSWNGSGIVTSETSATASTLTTIAVASASDVKGISGAQTATWGGQTVKATDVLVMYTYGGDANLDGKINADDYFQIDSNYNKSGTKFGYFNGDFNYDGAINGDDYFLIDSNFIGQGSPLPSAPAIDFAGVSAVPEPASFALLSLSALTILSRRFRRGT